MHPIDNAILKTVIYADVFNFALSVQELHRYLIHSQIVTIQVIQERLKQSSVLNTYLIQSDVYLALKDHANLIKKREQKVSLMSHFQLRAWRYGRWLSYIPFVEMVSLTGSLAVQNPINQQDDFDYMIVTQPNRVWLTRGMIIGLVKIMRLFNTELCPNYVVSTRYLTQNRQDLFIAHEITQMIPISGYDVYLQVYSENQWLSDQLPNATPYPNDSNLKLGWFGRNMKRFGEVILNWTIGDYLEKWEYKRKQTRFQSQADQSETSAVVNSEALKGHFEDHGSHILNTYQMRVKRYARDMEQIHPIAGD